MTDNEVADDILAVPMHFGVDSGDPGITADPIVISNDRLKIVIAGGGSLKTGTFHIVIG